LLFNATPRQVIFQLYHVENKLHFNELMMMMMSSLTNTLRDVVLAHSNNYPRLDMSCSLMLHAFWRSSINNNLTVWFDPTWAWTWDLPHSRWTYQPLYHWFILLLRWFNFTRNQKLHLKLLITVRATTKISAYYHDM
jgi:hypothetical protein